MKKSLKLALLTSASVLTLAACGDNTTQETTEPETEEATDTTENTTTEENTDTTDDNTDDQGDDQAANTDSQGIENMDFAVSLQDAVETFKGEVGDDAVQITDVNFDTENGTYVYEFTGFSNGTEYEGSVDAENGDVVDFESEAGEDMDDDVLDLDNVVDPSEAMTVALDSTGSGYVKEWELDVENGTPVYEIDIENASDVKVNAETGEVL
ncbi:MAG TPA: PepSY domain-containing protein [Alloiococcus sp.]|nr:PepSY domain-containing protein [Alloiococcus sp.]